jgi:predicted acyltransferase
MLGTLAGQWLTKTEKPEPEKPESEAPEAARPAERTFFSERAQQAAPQASPPPARSVRTSLPEKLNALFATGALAMMLGLMWNWSFPINKSLWTSSYVLFTAGTAAVSLATITWIVDIHKITWWTKPFIIFGTNPIVAFVGSEVMARTIYSLIKFPFHGKTVSLQAAIYQTAFASWLPPKDASLLFAVCIMLVWLAILTVLHRKQIYLKV